MFEKDFPQQSIIRVITSLTDQRLVWRNLRLQVSSLNLLPCLLIMEIHPHSLNVLVIFLHLNRRNVSLSCQRLDFFLKCSINTVSLPFPQPFMGAAFAQIIMLPIGITFSKYCFLLCHAFNSTKLLIPVFLKSSAGLKSQNGCRLAWIKLHFSYQFCKHCSVLSALWHLSPYFSKRAILVTSWWAGKQWKQNEGWSQFNQVAAIMAGVS